MYQNQTTPMTTNLTIIPACLLLCFGCKRNDAVNLSGQTNLYFKVSIPPQKPTWTPTRQEKSAFEAGVIHGFLRFKNDPPPNLSGLIDGSFTDWTNALAQTFKRLADEEANDK